MGGGRGADRAFGLRCRAEDRGLRERSHLRGRERTVDPAGGERRAVARGGVKQPAFEGHPWAPVLRALHHEILVNVAPDGPLPNRFVYRRPGYGDAAMVTMVLRRTGNLDLVLRDWILNIGEPFGRNNDGAKEADNPGQVLYLLSLVAAGSEHPLVRRGRRGAAELRSTGAEPERLGQASVLRIRPIRLRSASRLRDEVGQARGAAHLACGGDVPTVARAAGVGSAYSACR